MKSIPISNNIIPIVYQIGNSAERDKFLIYSTSKLVMAPYIKQIPNKIIPEAKEPNRKYFIPASLLFTSSLLLAAKTYKEIESTSMPRKNMDKFPKETMATAPAKRKILMAI